MILIDEPRPVRFRRYTKSSHLVSTLQGRQGTDELLRFAQRIGLRAEWLQNAGTPTEHFDVLGPEKFEQAVTAGAVVVTSRELVERVVRPKREATLLARTLEHEANLSEGGPPDAEDR